MVKKKKNKKNIIKKLFFGVSIFSMLFLLITSNCFALFNITGFTDSVDLNLEENVYPSPVVKSTYGILNANKTTAEFVYKLPSSTTVSRSSESDLITHNTQYYTEELYEPSKYNAGLDIGFNTLFVDYPNSQYYFPYTTSNAPKFTLNRTFFPNTVIDPKTNPTKAEYSPPYYVHSGGTAIFEFTISDPFVFKNSSLTEFLVIQALSYDSDTWLEAQKFDFTATVTTNIEAVSKDDKIVPVVESYVYSQTDTLTSFSVPLWRTLQSNTIKADNLESDYQHITKSTVKLVISLDSSSTSGMWFPLLEYRHVTTKPTMTINNRNVSLQEAYWDEYTNDVVKYTGIVEYLPAEIPGVTDWLGDTIAGFFDVEIFYGVKLSTVLGIILSITLTTILLKLFAGG